MAYYDSKAELDYVSMGQMNYLVCFVYICRGHSTEGELLDVLSIESV